MPFCTILLILLIILTAKTVQINSLVVLEVFSPTAGVGAKPNNSKKFDVALFFFYGVIHPPSPYHPLHTFYQQVLILFVVCGILSRLRVCTSFSFCKVEGLRLTLITRSF